MAVFSRTRRPTRRAPRNWRVGPQSAGEEATGRPTTRPVCREPTGGRRSSSRSTDRAHRNFRGVHLEHFVFDLRRILGDLSRCTLTGSRCTAGQAGLVAKEAAHRPTRAWWRHMPPSAHTASSRADHRCEPIASSSRLPGKNTPKRSDDLVRAAF